ncbi:hypothetical protein DPEC_G00350730 [Dallia pectoralis]|uniref:Uncharacterized protein n=1 Tax=Dallia pectoralis TaxID=75939 RepID=A0ACC2F1U9_DALPE|nr:hypothetical protein DPEC_G00350730 [Dallia pectoralis]
MLCDNARTNEPYRPGDHVNEYPSAVLNVKSSEDVKFIGYDERRVTAVAPRFSSYTGLNPASVLTPLFHRLKLLTTHVPLISLNLSPPLNLPAVFSRYLVVSQCVHKQPQRATENRSPRSSSSPSLSDSPRLSVLSTESIEMAPDPGGRPLGPLPRSLCRKVLAVSGAGN